MNIKARLEERVSIWNGLESTGEVKGSVGRRKMAGEANTKVISSMERKRLKKY